MSDFLKGEDLYKVFFLFRYIFNPLYEVVERRIMLRKIKWFMYMLVTDPFKKLKNYLRDLWLQAWVRANDEKWSKR